MLRGWRGRLLRSEYFLVICDYVVWWCGGAVLTIDRARLAKIKQNQAKAIGKRGKALGRKFHIPLSICAGSVPNAHRSRPCLNTQLCL